MKISCLEQHWRRLKTWLSGIGGEFTGISRPDIMRGFSIAVIILGPLLIAALLHQVALGTAVSQGAMFTALSNGGGTYRMRTRSMALGACLMALSGLLSALAGSQPFLVVAFTLLWTFSVSMLSVFGGAGTRLGNVAVIFFIIQLSTPADLAHFPLHCEMILLGSLLAMAAGLCLWPFRPMQPVRDSVAGYYQVLHSLSAAGSPDDAAYNDSDKNLWRQQIKAQRTRAIAYKIVRDAMRGSSKTPHQMYQLLLSADSFLAAQIALYESTRALSQPGNRPLVQEMSDQAAAAADGVFTRIVLALRKGRPVGEIDELTQIRREISETLPSSPEMSEENEPDTAALTNTRHLLDQYAALLQKMIGIVDGEEIETTSGETKEKKSWGSAAKDAGRLLKENWSLRSQHLRHALRLCLVVSFATAAYKFLKLPYGYWMPLAAAIILKPDFHATRERLWQRIGGTTAGGIVAFAAAALIYNPAVLFLLIAFFSFLAFVYRPRHYGIYAVFLTPFVVLSIDFAHLGSWIVAMDRVAYNLAGSVLATAAVYWLWPLWESKRLSDQVVRVFEVNRRFLHSVLTVNRPENAVKLRQQAILECVRATGSLLRAAKEPPSRKGDFEKLSPLVIDNQRLCGTLTALTVHHSPVLEAEARDLLQKLDSQSVTAMRQTGTA